MARSKQSNLIKDQQQSTFTTTSSTLNNSTSNNIKINQSNKKNKLSLESNSIKEIASNINAATSTSNSGTTSTSTTNSRKRKSVAFESEEPSTIIESISRTTRSRRSSTSTPLKSSVSTSTLSAKALGKRRAISPASEPATPLIESTTTSPPLKRRRLSLPSTLSAPEKDYNLRSRASTTSTPTTLEKPSKSISITSTSKQIPPSSSSSRSDKSMPRKGSRASRAAKAKARAVEDIESDQEENFDGLDDGEDDTLKHNTSGEKSEDIKMNDSQIIDQMVIDSPEVGAENGNEMLIASGAGDGGSEDGDEDHDEDEADNPFDEDDEDDNEDDEDDEDDEDEGERDDEEEDRYEASLGLGSEGGGLGDYNSGGESDSIDAPQTYDANGSPLPSSSSFDQSAAEEALAEAAEAAASGMGMSGGAAAAGFRALQGLMSGMSNRLKGILVTLRAKDKDSSAKLIALQDLAELLSVSTEDTLAGYFQVEAFVKEIVSILRGDSNGNAGEGGAGIGGMTPEEMAAFGIDPSEGGSGNDEENNVQMMLLACRCLANLMEALPGSAHSVVYAGAVPVLCSKLLEIQYIDLAEQTLSTLEKISEEVPSSIVREGGLGALLTYLDFFSFHVQRTAVTAAANCCRSLSPESFTMVRDVMPIFTNVLGYPDQRVVEQACLAVVRIVESYRHYPEKLEALLTSDLLVAIRGLLNPDSTTIGPRTYTQILKMLSTAAKASPEVAIALVELNIAKTLYHLLAGISAPDFASEEGPQVLVRENPGEDMLIMQNLVQRPKEQIQETLGLLCELLPPLPKDGIFDSRAFSGKERSSKTKVKKEEVTPDLSAPVPSTSTGIQVEAVVVKMETTEDGLLASTSSLAPPPLSTKEVMIEKRLNLLRSAAGSRPLLVRRYYALLLPTLVDVYSASVNTQVRTKAVLGLLKIINFCEAEDLAEILKTVAMSSFLAAILASRDQAPLITNALQLVELLLVKMPDAYQYFFRREGVMHEIEKIAASSIVSVSKSKKSSPSRTRTSSSSSAQLPDLGLVAPSGLTTALQTHDATVASVNSVTSTTSTPILSPSEALAKDMITLRARHLRDKYASTDSEPAIKARSALDNIRRLIAQLTNGAEAKKKLSRKEELEVSSLVEEVAALFSDQRNPLSSFEMLESGLVDGLLRFSSEAGWKGMNVIRRQELLATAFMARLEDGTTSPAFSLLVKRLQESLSRMEEFEVELAAQTPSEAESRRNGPSMLARQLKLRLVSEDGSDIPRGCSNVIVSIHAIATFQAFNDYLRPRILAASSMADRASGNSGAPRSEGAAGMLSGFLAAFAAANDSPTPSPEPEASGSRLSASPAVVASTSEGKPTTVSKRRRSSRLNKVDNEASTSATVLETADASEGLLVPGDRDDNICIDEPEEEEDEDDEDQGDDDLFAGAFDPTAAPKDDRPVNLEVADDGSKLIAKTPDGTRVGTPALGQSATTPSSATKPRASYASAVKTEPTDWHLSFSVSGHDVSLETTIYGAIHSFATTTPESKRNMWGAIYTVKFKKVPGPAKITSNSHSTLIQSQKDSALVTLPNSIPADSPQAKILQLLWVLHNINSDYGDANGEVGAKVGLTEAAFVNNKLTAKLNRQLEEPMIVASACLPNWANDLPQYFPFLFPFDTRHTFLQSTAFGYARLMQKWVGQARADSSRRDDNLGFLGRLQRQKVRISRDRMLDSAFKVFELYGSSRASLEVEFFSEVGSGLGPTLEFYALVSKEFARKELALWREGDASGSEFVYNTSGLFPSPSEDNDDEVGIKRLKVFRVLGQFIAKAMMDSRIIDVHFNRTFMKLVLDSELPLNIATVKSVDKDLGNSLSQLQEYVTAIQAFEADSTITEEERKVAIESIEFKGATLVDLTLDFTLPGHDIELKLGGKDISVDSSNVEEYIALVIEWTLSKGITSQVSEFKSGFSSVFPVQDLQSFTPSELVMMTGAIDEDWSVEGLSNSTKADHGFTMDSRPVKDFLSMMSEFTSTEKREFLSFITGSPRLPIGGFSALTPSLTIVRKDGGDGSLPSVMTCVNYIKLPDYSTREILKARVLTAVQEGAGGFHLS